MSAMSATGSLKKIGVRTKSFTVDSVIRRPIDEYQLRKNMKFSVAVPVTYKFVIFELVRNSFFIDKESHNFFESAQRNPPFNGSFKVFGQCSTTDKIFHLLSNTHIVKEFLNVFIAFSTAVFSFPKRLKSFFIRNMRSERHSLFRYSLYQKCSDCFRQTHSHIFKELWLQSSKTLANELEFGFQQQ